MSEKHYDVVVLGRSLGALVTAAILSRRDFRVLVFDNRGTVQLHSGSLGRERGDNFTDVRFVNSGTVVKDAADRSFVHLPVTSTGTTNGS